MVTKVPNLNEVVIFTPHFYKPQYLPQPITWSMFCLNLIQLLIISLSYHKTQTNGVVLLLDQKRILFVILEQTMYLVVIRTCYVHLCLTSLLL